MDESKQLRRIREARALLELHVGRSNTIKSQTLSTRLGGVDTLDSTPNTRAIIREVLDRYYLPVAGSDDGYFVVETEEEHQNAQARLDARIEGIKERKRLLRRAWERTERPDPQAAVQDYASETGLEALFE